MLKQEQIDYTCRRIPKEGVERMNIVSFIPKEINDYQGRVCETIGAFFWQIT